MILFVRAGGAAFATRWTERRGSEDAVIGARDFASLSPSKFWSFGAMVTHLAFNSLANSEGGGGHEYHVQ